MSKNCEREAGGLTAKKRWWLRAYCPRSVTHAWVCPRFPEKDEEVGSCGILSKVLLNSCGQASTNRTLTWRNYAKTTVCLYLSKFAGMPLILLLIAVIFLSGLWIELSSLPPHSLNFRTSMMVMRGCRYPDSPLHHCDYVPQSLLHFSGNHQQEKFPLLTISPQLSWQVLTAVFATSRKLLCHSLNKENSDVAWN